MNLVFNRYSMRVLSPVLCFFLQKGRSEKRMEKKGNFTCISWASMGRCCSLVELCDVGAFNWCQRRDPPCERRPKKHFFLAWTAAKVSESNLSVAAPLDMALFPFHGIPNSHAPRNSTALDPFFFLFFSFLLLRSNSETTLKFENETPKIWNKGSTHSKRLLRNAVNSGRCCYFDR